MIESIHLRKFKCLDEPNKINIKPLTILCGTNSSGKSSVIQSLLMLKQTFESQSRKNIVLNGQFVHLGPFEDLVFKKKPENKIQLNFELNFRDKSYNRKFFNNYFELTNDNQNVKKKLLEIGINLEKSRDKDPYVSFYEIKAKYLSNNGNYFEGTNIKFVSSEFEEREYGQYHVSWKKTIPYFPEAPLVKIPKDVASYYCPVCKSKHRANSQPGKDHYRYFYYNRHCYQNACDLKTSFINLVPDLEIDNGRADLTNLYNHIQRPLFALRHILQNEFSNLFYIGPLREEPSRRYISEEEIINIGNRGQNAPFILAVEKDKQISPYYVFDSCEEKWEKIEKDTLEKGVNRWLKYMDISEKCESIAEQDIIRLYLSTHTDKNVKATLADVGFGVSQILPILVEGLRIKPSQTLILEQPEIHLHPKLQMQLADFFISMILSGKNVIVETHSDHIINRISRRIIEDDENNIFSKTNILFFEQGNEGSVINEIELDQTRGVINWPSGFFDQSAEEKKMILSKGIERRNR